MVRSDKATAVAELTDQFRSSDGAVLTDYRGLSVKQLQDLRRALGDNASYAVVKNTLTKLAAKDAGVDGFDALLVGPTAIAFIKGDPVEAAKSLRDFAKDNSPLVIKGGILDGKLLTVDEIAKFADLESREVLLARLAGGLVASLSQAVSLFNAPLSQLARLAAALQAKAEADPTLLAAAADGSAPSPAVSSDGTTSDDTAETASAAPETAAVADSSAGSADAHPATAEADNPAADSSGSETTAETTAETDRPDPPDPGRRCTRGPATWKEPPPWRNSALTTSSTHSRR